MEDSHVTANVTPGKLTRGTRRMGKVPLNITILPDLRDRAIEVADQYGESLSGYIARLIRNDLKNGEQV